MRALLEAINRQKWVIVLVPVVTVALVLVSSSRARPRYSASAMVRVPVAQIGWTDYTGVMYAERVVNTQVRLLTSRPFLEEIAQRLGLSVRAEDLAAMIKVEALPNTELIRITVKHPIAEAAMSVANALAEGLAEQGRAAYFGTGTSELELLVQQLALLEQDIREDRATRARLETEDSDQRGDEVVAEVTTRIDTRERLYAALLEDYEQARVKGALLDGSIQVVEPATLPLAPSEPRVLQNVGVALVVGLIGGIGLGFVFESADRSVRSPQDLVGATRLPIIGIVPKIKVERHRRQEAVLFDADRSAPAVVAMQLLRSSVLPAGIGALSRPVTLLVTSVESRAGTSTIVANLGKAIAHGGRKVIMVDADLRHPSLHRIFKVETSEGLSTAMCASEDVTGMVQGTEIPGLRVLTSGPLSDDAPMVLDVMGIARVVRELISEADVILVDSPPISSGVETVDLAAQVDGILLVVALGQTPREGIWEALRQLDSVGATVLGTVLNKA